MTDEWTRRELEDLLRTGKLPPYFCEYIRHLLNCAELPQQILEQLHRTMADTVAALRRYENQH